MKLVALISIVVVCFASAASGAVKSSKPTGEAILRAAENIRNPSENYQVGVVLTDQDGTKKDVRTYGTFVKSRDKTLVQFLEPLVDRGTEVLMVGSQMWVYMPKVANPVRISPRQRLSGNAVYGDIARLDFAENYQPTRVREGRVDKQKAYVLDLKSIDGKAVTYDRIEYWVLAGNYRPHKALFQTQSGKVLREAHYKDFVKVFDTERPTKILFVDHLNQKHVTTLVLKNYQKRSLPDFAFDKMNLGRSLASFK
jgi:outer membrane lipoprotein-sorting protein